MLCMQTAWASPTILYQIEQNKVLVTIHFEETQNTTVTLPYDATAIESTGEYTLENLGSEKRMLITQGTNQTIKYIAKNMIEKTSENFFLIINKPIQETASIHVLLPEGAILGENEKPSAIPPYTAISTDGRRTLLAWENFSERQIIVLYQFVQPSSLPYILAIAALIILIAGTFIFKRKTRKKSKAKSRPRKQNKEHSMTKNLLREEKQIVEILLQKPKNELWTKELMQATQLSKVKLSRKIRALHEKGLIEKIPYGNENKIRLKK